MIGNLPMYDLPCVRAYTDAWWQGLDRAARGAGLPGLPVRSVADDLHAVWRAPDLVLSQICSYAIDHAYRNRLRVIAVPAFDADGCDGPRYRSAILVREDSAARTLSDLRGLECACNEPDSHSGSNSLARAAMPLAVEGRFFSGHRMTGAHVNSIAALRVGRADVCAVDCVTLALLNRHAPDELAGLRRIGYTASAPGLPYVTAAGTADEDMNRLRDAVSKAFADPTLSDVREALLLTEVWPAASVDYAEIRIWPRTVLGPRRD